jgi:hypothetical protein
VSTTLTFQQLETIYDQLAAAIDQAGPEREAIFLSKLALCMAQEWGRADRVTALIGECLKEPAPRPGEQKMI